MKSTKCEKPPGRKRIGVRINHPDDVRRLLAKEINFLLRDETTTDKLRAISYACQTILKVFELLTFEDRLKQIEELLKRDMR